MKKPLVLLLLTTSAALALSGCGSVNVGSARVDKKAEEYRQSGAARDLTEARRMAEDYYWPDSARIKEEAARRERAEALPKK